ncbi:hypothetical protein P170DRAFT_493665 [Aspergillus steynii IBT 23096]|uniref:Uncharacterized protein n=1 Tax=Aspergillus steynii IBT 23096 TaxID=1392250 RepID=A0A2I2GEN6_9EURO|nr:uncharacterized protein P170DRAFT_493665 [Aspergillus steynii IBT 23096]PLB51356.1 hypothetical protein P170DRAFT_493665 [Aspergillus steynii IBT 23096]
MTGHGSSGSGSKKRTKPTRFNEEASPSPAPRKSRRIQEKTQGTKGSTDPKTDETTTPNEESKRKSSDNHDKQRKGQDQKKSDQPGAQGNAKRNSLTMMARQTMRYWVDLDDNKRLRKTLSPPEVPTWVKPEIEQTQCGVTYGLSHKAISAPKKNGVAQPIAAFVRRAYTAVYICPRVDRKPFYRFIDLEGTTISEKDFQLDQPFEDQQYLLEKVHKLLMQYQNDFEKNIDSYGKEMCLWRENRIRWEHDCVVAEHNDGNANIFRNTITQDDIAVLAKGHHIRGLTFLPAWADQQRQSIKSAISSLSGTITELKLQRKTQEGLDQQMKHQKEQRERRARQAKRDQKKGESSKESGLSSSSKGPLSDKGKGKASAQTLSNIPELLLDLSGSSDEDDTPPWAAKETSNAIAWMLEQHLNWLPKRQTKMMVKVDRVEQMKRFSLPSDILDLTAEAWSNFEKNPAFRGLFGLLDGRTRKTLEPGRPWGFPAWKLESDIRHYFSDTETVYQTLLSQRARKAILGMEKAFFDGRLTETEEADDFTDIDLGILMASKARENLSESVNDIHTFSDSENGE